jgi:PAS domain S-box-containing protein
MTLIAGGNPLPVALAAIIQAVEAEDPAILCSILLLDDDGRRLLLGAAPSLPDAYNQAIHGVEIGPAAGSCGTAAFHGRRVIVEDIQTDPLWDGYKDLAAQAGLAACWSQPIVDASGAVVGTFAIYHRQVSAPNEEDIAFIEAAAELTAIAIDRQRAEQSLAASEARTLRAAEAARETARDLTTFFDVSLDMLCIRDMQGNFVKLSPAWEAVLGYPVQALEGTPLLPLIHPDDVSTTRDLMAQADLDDAIVGFVNRYRHRDGHYRQLEWRARRSGGLVFAVARDVTERMSQQAEMEAAKATAEAANRAKTDFLANMSHEIRTPLNGVIGVVAALGQTDLTPAQREMVELIHNSGATLERLVSDILDVSKIEAGHLAIEERPFDLDADLDGLLEITRIRAGEKGLAFRVERGADTRGVFRGDSIRIKQVLGNLLSNALKFTDRGEVAARIAVVDPALAGEVSRLTLEVRDTGVGFDPDLAATLFQRFSQADTTITRRFGGTGLGLSISKTLVEMMGGQIVGESEPGRGSLFRVTIPLARTQRLADHDAPPEPSAIGDPLDVRPGGLRVLLAEDHPINQKVVQLILAPYGAEVTVVENGALAIEAFKTGLFDLVLMDMQMPVMDGLAATRVIRAHEREQGGERTPIVMLSANAMDHHRQDALVAGADLHIAKPVNAVALMTGIGQALSPLKVIAS